jgi:hypothetical protein
MSAVSLHPDSKWKALHRRYQHCSQRSEAASATPQAIYRTGVHFRQERRPMA